MADNEEKQKSLTPEKREIVRMLTENLRDGAGLWRQNWFSAGAPLNASTRKPYRGVNNVYLTLLAMKRGYRDNRWVTYNQIKKEGWKFKEQEGGWTAISREAATIEFFELKDKSTGKAVDKSALSEMGKAERKKYLETGVRATKKTYKVYNVELVDGPESLALPEDGRSERAEKMIEYWSDNEAKIVYGGQDSYYSPPTDTIFIPERSSFIGYPEFYNTLFHEMAHSTGAQARMGRRFYPAGTYGYALEEMRAEIASLFLAQQFGVKIAQSSARNSSAYLSSWMEALRDDPNCFFDAVYEAEDIAKFVASKEEMADKMCERQLLIPPSQFMVAAGGEIESQTLTDEELVAKCSSGRGGEKFSALLAGKELFSEEERGDEIFLKRLALYTQDKTQMRRVYRSSKRRRQGEGELSAKIDSAASEAEAEMRRQSERFARRGGGRENAEGEEGEGPDLSSPPSGVAHALPKDCEIISSAQQLSDAEVLEKALSQGMRFRELYAGKNVFRDPQKNDLYFFERLAVHTRNEGQLMRIYAQSARRGSDPESAMREALDVVEKTETEGATEKRARKKGACKGNQRTR